MGVSPSRKCPFAGHRAGGYYARVGAILPLMDLTEAFEQANVIITEEERRPSLQYVMTTRNSTERINTQSSFVQQRKQRPRTVLRDPDLWEFRSPNYSALVELLNRLDEPRRGNFLGGLLNKTRTRAFDATVAQEHVFPMWSSRLSALPLVMEVCIRNGYTQLFLKVLSHVDVPTAAVAIMMLQLEETISVNFNVFSQQELKDMPTAFKPLLEMTIQHKKLATTSGANKKELHFIEAKSIQDGIIAFLKQCQQAHYWYVLGALQRKPNLEIESDRAKVVTFLDTLGFDDPLKSLLERAEALYLAPSDQFDLKNCLGLMRTLYEHMHLDAGRSLAAGLATTVVAEWDPTMTFLQNKQFLTPQQVKFARGLHTLLSDEGVHALIAETEFARLLRNMVIEYALMFLTILNKRGVKITP
jgi:hypothetical protein